MTKPRTGQSGNWDRERADRLQKDVERMQKDIERLTTERDALAQIKRHIDEVRNGTGWTVQIYGVLLQQCDQYGKTIDTRRAEWAEAERDALAAQVAEGFHLTEVWASDLATDAMVNAMDGVAIKAKQARNEARTWPDWRTASPDKAIEHDRSTVTQRTDQEVK